MGVITKWSFLLFSSVLFATVLNAQYPATGNKQRLGWQTTGDGLVYRGAIADTSTLDPSGLNNAWMLLDTVSGNLYAYRSKAWQLVSGGGGGVTMPFDSVTFNINEGDASEQELKYSAEKGYLQYGGLDSVQIPLLPGIWYVRNDDSVTVSKGMVVRASGTLGASGRIKVKRMIADGTIAAMYVLGIAMHDIAVGADGYVMTQGKIRQVNTTAYSEGAVLYADVDTLGGLTQTEPGNGYLKLPIAFVVHSASNGTLAVRVTPGAYMRDLHDVEVASPVSNASLYYNTSEGIWRDTTAAALKSDISGTTNYLAKFTGANTVGNSQVFDNGTNVGIGNTSPVSDSGGGLTIGNPSAGKGLHLYPSGSGLFMYPSGSSNPSFQITSSDADSSILYYTYFNYSHKFFTTNVERFRISHTGNVGINTASPARPLHVAGTTAIRIPVGTTGGAGSSENGDIRYNSTVNNFEWYQQSTGNWRQPVISANTAGGVSTGFAGKFAYYKAGGLDTSAVLIQNGSNIGIGTASATNLLTIKSQSTSDIPVSVRSSAASNINIVALSESNGAGAMSLKDKNGNTDIVLNTDITAFNISNDTTPPYIIAASYSPTSGNGPEINLSRARGTEASPSAVSNDDELGEINFSGRSTSSGQITAAIRALADSVVTSRLNTGLAFYTGATTATLTERMRINSKGKVGIGNSPAAGDSALTVTGGIRATTGVRATRLNVNTSGQTMSINNFYPSSNSIGFNLFIGGTGGQTSPGAASPNQNNIAIGYDNFTSASFAGRGHIAIGRWALEGSTTGFVNTAIGFEALRYNTTGYSNTAIGYQALRNNGSGLLNIAIGYQALVANTSGIYNTAIGNFALSGNISAEQNTAIGVSALAANTTGINNGGIGNYALAAKVTGNDNIAIGFEAGYKTGASAYVTDAIECTYIGSRSKSKTSGSRQEIAIGYGAIGNGSYTTTIGSSNTTKTFFQYGKTYIGTATDNGNFALQVAGGSYLSGEIKYVTRPAAAAVTNVGVDANGILREATSSQRFKDNITPYQKGLNDAMRLQAKTYTYKGDTTVQAGFIAEDVHEAGLTEYVNYDKEGKPYSLQYGNMVTLLLNAMKEQQAQIEALKKEIQELKNK